MSRFKERKEKICLNCNTKLHGRYCHKCGQENIEPKETIWHLIVHFFNDITHFDGKFFTTVKALLLKPGFLSLEYMAGKRVSYLNPIRMYIFISAFFFLFFFALINSGSSIKIGVKNNNSTSITKNMKDNFVIDSRFKNFYAYDSAMSILPKSQKDGWIIQKIKKNLFLLQEKYGYNYDELGKALFRTFIHHIPHLLFVLLPLFALSLKLLYSKQKHYYYTDHGIFSIYLYCATFLFILLILGIEKLKHTLGWEWLSYIALLFVANVFIYFYFAMKRFYSQSWTKTLIKFCILNILNFILLIFLITVFFFFSLFEA